MVSDERHRDFPGFWGAVLILVLFMGVQILVSAFFHDLGLYSGPWDAAAGWAVYVISAGLLISLLMGYRRVTYRVLFDSTGVAGGLVPLIPPLLVTSMALSLVGGFAGDQFVRWFPPSERQLEMFRSMLESGLLSVVVVIFIGPFIEEVIFRGLILRSFLTNYSPVRAVVYSSLLFALYHLNIYQIPFAFVFGLLGGWLYHRTGTLWPSLGAHVVVNAIAVGLTPKDGNVLYTPEPWNSPVLATGAAAVLALGIFWTASVLRPSGKDSTH